MPTEMALISRACVGNMMERKSKWDSGLPIVMEPIGPDMYTSQSQPTSLVPSPTRRPLPSSPPPMLPPPPPPSHAQALVATCSGQDDAQLQEALSAVLAPVQYWPRWAAPPGSPRKGAAGGSHAGWGGEAEEGEGQEDGDDSAGGSLEASFTSHADLASRCKVIAPLLLL